MSESGTTARERRLLEDVEAARRVLLERTRRVESSVTSALKPGKLLAGGLLPAALLTLVGGLLLGGLGSRAARRRAGAGGAGLPGALASSTAVLYMLDAWGPRVASLIGTFLKRERGGGGGAAPAAPGGTAPQV